ncbi:hypothetical protein K9M59_04250 [Candidatus Gracilibacteria bacterium]|nr:hypothetical protein [Candidatus Gracilibacteria bacterium]MCF7819532.1 hypothetical protein [Candidatus Gracilibacteria bacterium]
MKITNFTRHLIKDEMLPIVREQILAGKADFYQKRDIYLLYSVVAMWETDRNQQLVGFDFETLQKIVCPGLEDDDELFHIKHHFVDILPRLPISVKVRTLGKKKGYPVEKKKFESLEFVEKEKEKLKEEFNEGLICLLQIERMNIPEKTYVQNWGSEKKLRPEIREFLNTDKKIGNGELKYEGWTFIQKFPPLIPKDFFDSLRI